MAPTEDLSQEFEPQPQRVEIVFAGFKVDLNLTSVFLKITRISIQTDRHLTNVGAISCQYNDDTSLVLPMILDVLVPPNSTNQYHVCYVFLDKDPICD
jgi:hypothetical protein